MYILRLLIHFLKLFIKGTVEITQKDHYHSTSVNSSERKTAVCPS